MDPIATAPVVVDAITAVTPAATSAAMPPEVPGGFDLLSAGACLVVAELAKTWADSRKNPSRAEQVRRWLPWLLLFVGASVRAALEMADGGSDPKTALMRGAVAGAMSVYGHAIGKSATGSSSFLTDAVQAILMTLKLKKSEERGVKSEEPGPPPVSEKKTDPGSDVQPPTDRA